MSPPSAIDPSAAAYNAQLQIRREAEERSMAQQELNTWMSEIKVSKESSNKNRFHYTTGEMSVNRTTTLQQKPLKTNDSGGFNLEEERLRGNSFFAQGKYHEAIQSYTRCLSDKDALKSPVIYSNRGKPKSAQDRTSLKTKNWINAESDATAALNIDRHFKSYQRRCIARLSLGKLRAAMMDACAAEDCLSETDSKSLIEIHELQKKVQNSFSLALSRAPRRNIKVEVIRG